MALKFPEGSTLLGEYPSVYSVRIVCAIRLQLSAAWLGRFGRNASPPVTSLNAFHKFRTCQILILSKESDCIDHNVGVCRVVNDLRECVAAGVVSAVAD